LFGDRSEEKEIMDFSCCSIILENIPYTDKEQRICNNVSSGNEGRGSKFKACSYDTDKGIRFQGRNWNHASFRKGIDTLGADKDTLKVAGESPVMDSAVSNTVNAAFRISNRIADGKCDWKWSQAPGCFFKAQAAAMALRQTVSNNVIINKECYIKSNQEVKKNSDVVVVTKAVAVDQYSDNVVSGVVSGSSYIFSTDLLVIESVGSNVDKLVRKEKENEKEKEKKRREKITKKIVQ
jgi:hypothetical protein